MLRFLVFASNITRNQIFSQLPSLQMTFIYTHLWSPPACFNCSQFVRCDRSTVYHFRTFYSVLLRADLSPIAYLLFHILAHAHTFEIVRCLSNITDMGRCQLAPYFSLEACEQCFLVFFFSLWFLKWQKHVNFIILQRMFCYRFICFLATLDIFYIIYIFFFWFLRHIY